MTTVTNPPDSAFKTRVFLFGADMEPTTIIGRWPGGRFVGIAQADGALTQRAGLGAYAFGPEIWGIIVEIGAEQHGTAVSLTLLDGAPATAVLPAKPVDVGPPFEILAEANYWELPQAYRDRIQAYIDSEIPA
jgi:hypothetical protein